METAQVNVRFSCQATRCSCEVVIQAKVTSRPNAQPLYEYNAGTQCPKCGHRLFGQHQPVGEEPAQA